MGDFFARDNWYTRFMEKLFDLCLLNIIFVLTCIPVITLGASITALYSVLMKMTENKDSQHIRSYFRAFKENFAYGTKQFFFPMLLLFLMLFDIGYWASLNSEISPAGYVATSAMIMLWCCWMMWLCPLSVVFDNTVKATMVNAGKFALSFLPFTFLISAASLGVFVLFLANPLLMPLLMLGVFAIIAYGQCVYVRYALKKYMRKHPEMYGVQVIKND